MLCSREWVRLRNYHTSSRAHPHPGRKPDGKPANAASLGTCCPIVSRNGDVALIDILDGFFDVLSQSCSTCRSKWALRARKRLGVRHHVIVQIVPFEKWAAAPLERAEPRSFSCSSPKPMPTRMCAGLLVVAHLDSPFGRENTTCERAIDGARQFHSVVEGGESA